MEAQATTIRHTDYGRIIVEFDIGREEMLHDLVEIVGTNGVTYSEHVYTGREVSPSGRCEKVCMAMGRVALEAIYSRRTAPATPLLIAVAD